MKFKNPLQIKILGSIQKVCPRPNTDFWPPSLLVTLCHLLPWPPSPLVTTQIVTNFELIMCRPLMQILDLKFAKMSIFSVQTLLSIWKATLKSRWSDVITTFKVILMGLLKQYFWKSGSTLWLIPASPISHFVIFWSTSFLNGSWDN